MYECLISFTSPTLCCAVGDVIKKLPKATAKDLLRAGYIREVKDVAVEKAVNSEE